MTTSIPPGIPPVADSAAEAQSWLDVQSLDSLKAATVTAPTDPKTLRAVAQQFESLFISMMLKSMREAKLGDGLFDSDQGRFYQDLFDQQLSVTLSQGRGLGIADMLVRGLTPPGTPPAAASGTYGRPLRRAPSAASAPRIEGTTRAAGEVPDLPVAAAGPDDGGLGGSAEAFIERVLPAATAAGSALGVDPRALIAQAALESNWGRQVPTAADGSSYNLFGIKADASWEGRRVVRDTIEYAGGTAERRREPFRAYDSIEHGFADYVTFLSNHDRYSSALRHGRDPERFAAALQEAGYATDPAYSTKIAAVLRSRTFQNAVAALKDSGEPPIF